MARKSNLTMLNDHAARASECSRPAERRAPKKESYSLELHSMNASFAIGDSLSLLN